MIYTCDTNFILRYIVGDNSEMLKRTTVIFDKIKNAEIEVVIESDVLAEVVYVLSSFYNVPRKKISVDLIALLSYRGFVIDHELYTEALKLYDYNHKLDIVDCLLAARVTLKDMQLLSFDKALLKQVQK